MLSATAMHNGMYYSYSIRIGPVISGPAESTMPWAMPLKVLYHINWPGKSGHLDNLETYFTSGPYESIPLNLTRVMIHISCKNTFNVKNGAAK